MTSSPESSWEVDTETVDLTLSTFPTICGWVLSNEYLSLSEPLLMKNTSGELRVVFIPIVLIFLFVTYKFWGKSNVVSTVDEVEIEMFEPIPVNITGWLFVNGWFSI